MEKESSLYENTVDIHQLSEGSIYLGFPTYCPIFGFIDSSQWV